MTAPIPADSLQWRRASAALAAWYSWAETPNDVEVRAMSAALEAPDVDAALLAWFGTDLGSEQWRGTHRDAMRRAREAATAVTS